MSNALKEKLYNNSKKRWQKAEASLTGIMDGFESVHDADAADSCAILEKLIANKKINPNYVIDCGAGIGRVSQHVLAKYFAQIDILERDQKFVDYCHKNFAQNPKIKNIFCDSLENFQFDKLYDAIWIQWCLQDLQNDDLTDFLMRCKKSLAPNGVIIVKENIMHEDNYLDEHHGCEIRTSEAFEEIFRKCNLKTLHQSAIPNWPATLLPVFSVVLA